MTTIQGTQQVVVAYSFSAGGLEVLERAVALARRAPFHVLHVVTVIDPDGGIPAIPPSDAIDYGYAESVQVAVTEVVRAALAADAAPHDVHFFVHARFGKPAEEILELAREVGADLIMVGTHDHGPIRRALLGSTAARVVSDAGCPVVVARAKTYPTVKLLDVVADDHPHHPYMPPHRYCYRDDRLVTRPVDWPLF